MHALLLYSFASISVDLVPEPGLSYDPPVFVEAGVWGSMTRKVGCRWSEL